MSGTFEPNYQAKKEDKDRLLTLLEDEIPEGAQPLPTKRKVLIGDKVEVWKGRRIKITDIEGQPFFKVTCVRPNGKVTLVNKKKGRIVIRGSVVDA